MKTHRSSVVSRPITLALFLLISTVSIFADNELVPLVTDLTPIAISDKFAIPAVSFVSQNGTYAFTGSGASAVFYKAPGASTRTMVFQQGDEAPGFPGSRIDLIQPIRLSNTGLLVMKLDFQQLNGISMGAIYSYDGTTLTTIAKGTDLAPGGGGANFERNITPIGVNDAGDVAFTATLVVSGTTAPLRTTAYVAPAGGGPIVRIAGLGDLAPDGVNTYATFGATTFNNLGEIGFTVRLNNASTGTPAAFVGKAGSVRKIIANGDANPVTGGTLTYGGGAPALNNSGDSVMALDGGASIWLRDAAGALTRRVLSGAAGDVTPIGGTYTSPSLILQAVNDAGDIAFTSNVTGGSAPHALFRARSGNPTEVVAQRNQSAAGAAGHTFNSFALVTINATGQIAFFATLNGGTIPSGIYQQSGTGTPLSVAITGQASGLPGGGTLRPQQLFVRIRDDASVHFAADVPDGGEADYAELLSSGGALTPLMTTGDPLPAASRKQLKPFKVAAAGEYVGFFARRSAGKMSQVIHHIPSHATTVVVTEGQAAPGTSGGIFRGSSSVVQVNSSGTVVFQSQIIGGPKTQTNGVFIKEVGSPVTNILLAGDVDPNVAGRFFNTPALGSTISPRSINDAGQVVLLASSNTTSVGGPRGIYIWSQANGVQKVAATNETIPGSGTIGSLTGSIVLNNNGQVAAVIGTTTPTASGIYVGAVGSGFMKVARSSEPAPGGGTFTSFTTPSFNNSGEVAFIAALNTLGTDGGAFVGTAGGALTVLARHGSATPAGGNYQIIQARTEIAINDQHDIVFRTDVANGPPDSAYFIRRGTAGPLHSIVTQGQSAPGTSGGTFDTLLNSLNNFQNENMQLSQTGMMAFSSFYLNPPLRVVGNWNVKADDTLEEIIVRGVVSQELGGGQPVVNNSALGWNSGDRYPVWARISGGTFTEGIFLSVPIVTTPVATGSNVPVAPVDSTTGTTPVEMTFDNITTPGETTVVSSAGGPTVPSNFAMGDPPLFYNIDTTATFSGSIQVCFDISTVSFPSGAPIRLLHFNNGAWEDVTTSVSSTEICGSVTSLSPFTVVEQLAPPDGDNDGIEDAADNCPSTPNADQLDTDADHAGNVCDADDDNDGVLDVSDAFPLNASESVDTDHDGTGNNADLDDDNDGQSDVNELGCGSDPLNALSKSPDADHDNIPDCVDPDDDNDGIPDTCDINSHPGAQDYDHDGMVDGSGCDTVIGPPTNKDQCKNNGWQFWTRGNGSTFKNQGDCVSFTNNGH